MKHILLLLFLAMSALSSHAQIVEYFINKECSNSWDNSMNAWSGWSAWTENNLNNSRSVRTYNIKVSASAIQYIYDYYRWSEEQQKYYTSNTVTTYTFVNDIADSAYPFNKSVRITQTISYSDKDDYDKIITNTYNGTGSVYSKLPLNQLLAGNAIGEIYMYSEYSPQEKRYYAASINRKSTAVLAQEQEEREQAEQDRQDEIEEAQAEQQRKKQAMYENLGKAIGTLLIKKK
ncbi:hypothetical protein ACR78F_12785 [Sphingobacterium spiritivorum]|uniref:hypothetical protein n=1 Tax=Sphingobacterium spiritivorum TaxID=258 RepID=UPI003DA1E93E